MKDHANRLMVEHVAKTFRDKGFKSFVKVDGGKAIAVPNLGDGCINMFTRGVLAGIDRVEPTSESFDPAKEGFLEASEFFN